jgi:beta-mannanase
MRAIVAAAALSVCALGCGSASSPQGPQGPLPGDGPAPPAKKAPLTGALFGAFVGVGGNAEQDFLDSEKLIDRKWVIDHRFYSIEDWIGERTPWSIEQNKIPMITWEPHETLDDLIAGKHDEMIKAKARGARDLKAEIFMRWGHEMNGDWYPWSGAKNGKGTVGPQKYIEAYRHVFRIFKQEGAHNVVWVWCPLVTNVPDEPWNHWSKYYPGDEYVDWIGFDAYNWGTSSSCCRWMSFRELITPIYRDYAGKGKPLMIPEFSSAEKGGNKAEWITTMHNELKTDFTEIRALVWFHINKETDWRIDSSPATLKAYKAMALDPYFDPPDTAY